MHGERGAVTVAALAKLLERVSPDVVFAEIPKSHAARYANGSHGTLESRAIADYSQRHQVTVVPVDRDEPSEEFFRVTRELFELVERRSRDYRNLVDLQSERSARGGFRYLNSAESAQSAASIRNEVRDTIDWMRAPELHAVHEMWIAEIELRDQQMLANIARYAATSAFATAVFLVGAAHRQSIVEKVASSPGVDRSSVQWQLELPSEMFE